MKTDWVNNFITKCDDGYEAWDETQAHSLGKFISREEAYQKVISYAEYLESTYKDEDKNEQTSTQESNHPISRRPIL